MLRIALVTATAAHELDEDLPPLLTALRAHGADAAAARWDDAAVDWSGFDLAVLRSTWDYAQRLPEFLAWAARAAAVTRLLNPLEVIRWNTDKHYLADLASAGVACVPSAFVEPGASAGAALAAFLADTGHGCAEFVVKPSIGAGSRDTQRYARGQQALAGAHIGRLLGEGRGVLLQPYLERVDAHGETALIYLDGGFSHAIRKGPLLQRNTGPTQALFAAEDIRPREASVAELDLAARVLGALPHFPGVRDVHPLAYARVDLIHAADGSPRLLELELAEPSLFFDHAPGAAERFASALLARLATN